MSELKENILYLHGNKFGYKLISKILKCSRGTISYYCSPKGKENHNKRIKLHREMSPLSHKYYRFIEQRKIDINKTKLLDTKIDRVLYFRVFDFLRGSNMKDLPFTVEQLKEKIGPNPKCYLTGDSIDLSDRKSYQLDHKIPRSKGGDNSLHNCEICTSKANQSKTNLTKEEYIELCKKVLEYNNYEIRKLDTEGI